MTKPLSQNLSYTLLINCAPQQGRAAYSAYLFASAVLDAGLSIHTLFFYGEGVHNANKLTVMPQDESNLPAQWDALIQAHKLHAIACVSSAIRRGVLDTAQSTRHDFSETTCYPSFEIGGLGQFVSAVAESDRLVSFG